MKTNEEKASFWENEIFRVLSKRALESISPSDRAAARKTIAEMLNENSVETIRMLAHDEQREHLLAAGRCGTDSLETEIVNLRNRQHDREKLEREQEKERQAAMERSSKRK